MRFKHFFLALIVVVWTGCTMDVDHAESEAMFQDVVADMTRAATQTDRSQHGPAISLASNEALSELQEDETASVQACGVCRYPLQCCIDPPISYCSFQCR